MGDTSGSKAITAINKAGDDTGLSKTPTFDQVRNGIIAGLNVIPLIGGSLGSLADSYIPKKKEERLIAFVEDLAKRVRAIEKDIKPEKVETEIFAYVFERTFTGVAQNFQQDKIDSYKAVLTNSLTDRFELDNEETEIFLNILDSLTIRHLRILAILKQNTNGDLVTVIQTSYSDYDKDTITYIMDDLRSKGLIPLKPTIYDADLGNNFNQLSDMGKKFTDFITNY